MTLSRHAESFSVHIDVQNDYLSLPHSFCFSSSPSLGSGNCIGADGATCLSTSLSGLTSMQTFNIRCVCAYGPGVQSVQSDCRYSL